MRSLPAGVQLFSLLYSEPGAARPDRRRDGRAHRCSPITSAAIPCCSTAYSTAGFFREGAGPRRHVARPQPPARLRRGFPGPPQPDVPLDQGPAVPDRRPPAARRQRRQRRGGGAVRRRRRGHRRTLPRGRGRVREDPRQAAGPRPCRGGAGQARQPRDDGHLRPRFDLHLRHSGGHRGLGHDALRRRASHWRRSSITRAWRSA